VKFGQWVSCEVPFQLGQCNAHQVLEVSLCTIL